MAMAYGGEHPLVLEADRLESRNAVGGGPLFQENPPPLHWTKTADQILESIARYCTRINGSGR
jgi:hypothetical protein